MRRLLSTVIALALSTSGLVIAATAATLADTVQAGGAPLSTAIDHSSCSTWLRLVDVSSNQGSNINWTDVSHGGFVGAYIKTTEGLTYVNPYATKDQKAAAANGLAWGSYDYANPTLKSHTTKAIIANATADARYFVAHSNVKHSALPPVLDMEGSSGFNKMSGAQVVTWATTWIHTVSNLTARIPTIYTGAFTTWSASPALTIYPLWVAAYPLGEGKTPKHSNACGIGYPHTGGWHGFSVWQYADAGLIYGVGKGDVDAATLKWWNERAALGIVLVVPPNPTKAGNTVVNRYPAPVYTVGSKGPAVIKAQAFLKARGMYAGRIDGLFGQATRVAVQRWEAALAHMYPHAHILTDGELGPLVVRYTNFWIARVEARVHHKIAGI